MHVPDGFFDLKTSAGAGVLAAGAVAVALRGAGAALDDRRVPVAGLVAAFVFAAQMANFPVAAGTSGHLVGGVLAAVLVGPHVAALCMTVVLVAQALLFADGGLTALGLNLVNLVVVGTYGGWALFRGLRRLLPAGPASTVGAAGVAAGLAVVAAAAAFSLEYAVGGVGGAEPTTVARAMVGVHVPIGVGEALITAATLSSVLASRPDLVWAGPGTPAPSPPALAGNRR